MITPQQSLYFAHKSRNTEEFHHAEWLENGGKQRLEAIGKAFDDVSGNRSEPTRKKVGNAIEITYGRRIPERKAETDPTQPIRTGESVAFSDGKRGFSVEPLADSDDGPIYKIETNRQWKHLTEARKIFLEASVRETGNTEPAERIDEKRAEKQKLKEQSMRIAGILERNGVPAFRNDEHNIYIEYLHSGKCEMLPKFRRICFLPYVAAGIRAPTVTALQSYLEENPFCRMWTFTNGQRVKVSESREAIKKFHRKLSRFATWLRPHGVEMVFRSTELGTPETEEPTEKNGYGLEKDGSGNSLLHVHAHTLVRLIDGPMSREAWSGLIQKVWHKWGKHWDAGKSVQKVQELCKYVFKPEEVLSLSESEICELYHQLKRLKICAPLGELRDTIRARKEAKERLIRMPTPDGPVLRSVPDWNRSYSKITELEQARKKARKAGILKPAPFDRPQIISQCLPGYAPGSYIKEPRIMVLAKHRDRMAVLRHPLVVQLADLTRDHWQAAKVLSNIRVHTGTPTDQKTESFGFVVDLEERIRPPGEPLFQPQQLTTTQKND